MSLLANSNAIETGGYQISRSVRLRSSASAYFSRTPGSAGNQQRFTLSAWVKLGTTSTTRSIINCWSGNQYFDVRFDSGNSFYVLAADSGGSLITNISTSAVYRDPSAWYHVMVSVDTTQATANNRVILYINGAQPNTTYTTTPTQNYSYILNSTNLTTIGKRAIDSTQLFDGYLTEINFIDGQALTPSSFGQTDTITGSWVAKKYTGTYGTNGFYLNFSDNSAATSTTIGKDYSGNGNNWTPNNISVTAGTTYDSMLDVPSGNGGNYCVLNPLILVPAGTISNGNLDYSRGSTASHGSAAASFTLPTTGKWYWEVTACSSANNEMIGIANIQNNPQLPAAGSEIGGGSRGDYGYRSDGNKYNNGNQGAYGATYSSGNIIGVAWNSDAGTLVFYKNGTSQGTAFSSITQSAGKFAPAVSSAETSPDSFNFGQRPFSYAVPSGYSALNTTNLSDPTIKNGAGYFAATLYAGSSSAQSITNTVNGVSFQPDLVWGKNRSNINSHRLTDSVRGVGKVLFSNDTAGDTTGDGQLASFNSNGWTFTSGAGAGLNESGNNYVAWNWKANGTGVTNTAGSITSTVSANTTSGFSIVTYTGNGIDGATVGHGLGVVPSMVIQKRRDGSIANWRVWHRSVHATSGETNTLYLNLTSANTADADNISGVSSTTFTTRGTGGTNPSGNSCVAYVFAAVPGYSAFGSYTGNGSTDGVFVYTGFRPRFVLVKQSSSTTNWFIVDSARDTYNVVGLGLNPNTSSAESSGDTFMDMTSNGFKIRQSTGAMNTSSGTYIYAAFAENPFKYSNAR